MRTEPSAPLVRKLWSPAEIAAVGSPALTTCSGCAPDSGQIRIVPSRDPVTSFPAVVYARALTPSPDVCDRPVRSVRTSVPAESAAAIESPWAATAVIGTGVARVEISLPAGLSTRTSRPATESTCVPANRASTADGLWSIAIN